jgi:hypothetical protein
MAARPDMRVGDADREASAASLREHYAQGRLSLEEFNERLNAVFAATTQRHLDEITSDLPHVRTPVAPLPVSATGATSGGGSGTGRSRRGRGGSPLAGMAFGLAVLALWLITLVPGLWDFRIFSLPSRFPVFVIGLLIIRSLFRRVFGRSRGWGGCSGRRGR